MPTQLSIHPQYSEGDRTMRLCAGMFTPENSNALNLEFNCGDPTSILEESTRVTVFGLDDVTAEALHLFAKLTVHDRAKLLTHLRIIAKGPSE